MEALQPTYGSIGYTHESRGTWVHYFFDWCKNQEKNRLLWLAFTITVHGCIITPLTMMLVVSSLNSMLLLTLVIAAMSMSVVSNLAALPTKITIPVFFLSLLIDLGVIISCVFAVVSSQVV